MPQEKKRQVNFELLRVVAMLMIITLHYLSKGNVEVKLSVDGSLYNHAVWLIGAFCNAAVNAYVLISGYFLVEAKWNPKKLLSLLLQVLFYSILIPVILLLFGMAPVTDWNAYDWMNAILPIQTEHYWFATAYVVLYMLAPLLAAGIKNLSKKQLQITIGLLLLFFCIPKSINPVLIATDHYGYDYGWFICLFLIAGYIRLYGLSFFKNEKRSVILYVIFVIANFGVCALMGLICRRTGKLEYYMDMTYSYNYILVVLSSIALFYIFMYIKIPDGKLAKCIGWLAPCTFGVYLLHENLAVRLQWPGWLGIESVKGTPLIFAHLIISILIVFIVGVMVDRVRITIFDAVKKLFKK